MPPDAIMRRIDELLSHVWMVRTFVKHSEEAEEDAALQAVVRDLYDACLAVGPAWTAQNAAEYLKVARKKYANLRAAGEQFAALQPQVSAHTNFKMAVASLGVAVREIGQLLSASAAADDVGRQA